MSGPLRGEAVRALLRPLVAALAAFLLLLSCPFAVLPEGGVPCQRVTKARMLDRGMPQPALAIRVWSV